MSTFIDCDCLELEQPIGKYYIGIIDWDILEEIASADVRRIKDEGKSEMQTYLGIQRKLSQKRVKDIAEYVNLDDATFPTSIILAISSEDAFYDEKSKVLKIRKGKDVANIIDGQHRVMGLKEGFGQMFKKKFQLSVTIFIDMDIEDQAMTFATINKAQTKVNKSLVYDLFAYARTRSPQKSCHMIVRELNFMKESPFYDKIKILGVASNKSKTQTITQATFVENLLLFISDNPVIDRDLMRRGKKIEAYSDKKKIDKYFLRSLFINDKDDDIAVIFWHYFDAVRRRWSAWDEHKEGNILNKSTGFIGLMKFFREAYPYLIEKHEHYTYGDIIESDVFLAEVFDKCEQRDEYFTPDNYKPGSSGHTQLYTDLKKSLV